MTHTHSEKIAHFYARVFTQGNSISLWEKLLQLCGRHSADVSPLRSSCNGGSIVYVRGPDARVLIVSKWVECSSVDDGRCGSCKNVKMAFCFSP